MNTAVNTVADSVAASDITAGQVWAWLADVPDPEIPVISIVDLGIVRAVDLDHSHESVVATITITPTYSGCPAMAVIADAVTAALRGHGLSAVTLRTQIVPAWTTDWMSEGGKARLRDYGIAPPRPLADGQGQVIDISRLRDGPRPMVCCPRCGSARTEALSQFGSTPCKALYRCLACREPFDYFKAH
jgi:ring-1,2-phenylacetyl-CoA epoxidase subunit PaaD